MSILRSHSFAAVLCILVFGQLAHSQDLSHTQEAIIPGTSPLKVVGDIPSQMIEGVSRFLSLETQKNVLRRQRTWESIASEPEFVEFLNEKRQRLAHILGVRDARIEFEAPELQTSTRRTALLAKSEEFEIYAVRWPVLKHVDGEGILLLPVNRQPIGDVVAIPDADQTPEQFAGLVEGGSPKLQMACRLAETGYRVIVPTLINRQMQRRAPPGQKGRASLTNREYVYRPSFELGRHLIGYELQKVLACIDWFEAERGGIHAKAGAQRVSIGVAGYGEGGMLALYAAALDPRINLAWVSGYFGPRDELWKEPVDRNIFGLLTDFGGAELACMTYPCSLFVDFQPGPSVDLPSDGGALEGYAR